MSKVAPSSGRRIAILSLVAFTLTVLLASLAGHRRFVPGTLSYAGLDIWGGRAEILDDADSVAIIMIDTRMPVVPHSPETELSFWTISILHNYLYAKSIGVPFLLFTLDPLMQQDGVTPQLDEGDGDVCSPAYCKHPEYGYRMIAFCKLVVVWDVWRRYPSIDNLIIIDSDAVFKSPANHIQSHLDHLSRRCPVGFLKDLPYDGGPCAGYWFAMRGKAAIPHSGDPRGNETGVEFLEDWWNMDWAETDYKYDREQGLLKKMVRDRQGTDQVNAISEYEETEAARVHHVKYKSSPVLANEWQFEDRSDDQMVVHVNHLQEGKQSVLLAEYFSWPDHSLADRTGLQVLLDEIKVQKVQLDAASKQVGEVSENRNPQRRHVD